MVTETNKMDNPKATTNKTASSPPPTHKTPTTQHDGEKCRMCKQGIIFHAKDISYHGESEYDMNIRTRCGMCNECYASCNMFGRVQFQH